MIDTKDIYWLAGLLEGEGCFSPRNKHNPTIQLIMTDKDVVIRAAKILGAYAVIQGKTLTKGGKQIFRVNVYGSTAIGWMMTLYSLLGDRRQTKIREMLETFKNKSRRIYPERKFHSRGSGTVVWESGR